MLKNAINNLKGNYKYLASSFLAGFGLMTLEMTATRIVAPYIGNSIYTWTAIIGTVLLGSSIGYIWGGIKIDKKPEERVVSYFSFSAGLFILLINFVASFLSEIALSGWSVLTISLLSAVVLFFIPSVLIGTISPCLVKLGVKEVSNVGIRSGMISAFWAIGSVAGTILTGFVFVGLIGSQEIIILVSFLFFLISVFFLKNKVPLLLIVMAMIFLQPAWSTRSATAVYQGESKYYSIEVADGSVAPYGKIRALFLDFGSHSIESLESKKIHNYPEAFPILFAINPDIKDIYIIGGGAQTMSKKILTEHQNVNMDSIDIDPEVNEISKEYFSATNDRINYLEGDARLALLRSQKKYDLIFGDAFNSVISVPGHLLTDEFNKLAKSRLEINGIYAVNISSSLSGENSSLFKSVAKTFRETFSNNIIISFGSSPSRTQNIVLVGSVGENKINLDAIKESLKTNPDGEWLSSLISPMPRSFDADIFLTDNFYPTEKLLLGNINSYFNQYAKFYYSLSTID